MPFTLPALPYAPDVLEPYIDKMTMEIHHGKHQAAYVTNLNKALESAPELQNKPVHELLATNLAIVPKAGVKPVGNLAKAIDSTFTSFDKFKELLTTAATTRFGSGWAWLIKKGAKVEIISLPNQDSPIMES